ncbi:MAG: hypothetical protein ACLFSQ_12335 [Candidatus Zixiibacteriota bacterium]
MEKVFEQIKEAEEAAEDKIQSAKEEIAHNKSELKDELNKKRKALEQERKDIIQKHLKDAESKAEGEIKRIDAKKLENITKIEKEFSGRIGKASDEIIKDFGIWQ